MAAGVWVTLCCFRSPGKGGREEAGQAIKPPDPPAAIYSIARLRPPKGFTAKAAISCSDLDRVLVVICTVARVCFETRATYRAEICFIHNAAIKINDDLSLSF